MIAPYTRLYEACRKWARTVVYPSTKQMYVYTKEQIESERYVVGKVMKEKIETANKLGWEVVVECLNGELVFSYRQRPGTAPWELKL